MTGLPARRMELAAPSKPEADWTARLALGGAGAFGLLLLAFGLILYQSWPQMSGVRRSIATLADKTERIATGQEVLSRDIASLRGDLREDRSGRTESSRELAAFGVRVNEISASLASLRAQTEKLESQRATPVEVFPVRSDPEIAELRSKIDVLQRRLDQAAALPPPPSSLPVVESHLALQPPLAVAATASASVGTSAVQPVAPRASAYPVEEIEREVRDMQSVIVQQQDRTATQRAADVPISPVTGGIADPLAPMTSKTPPRIAAVEGGDRSMVSFTLATGDSALVSRVASVPTSARPVELNATPAAHTAALSNLPEPRVTRVGVNSAMNAIGAFGLPFDAIGNLFTAIGEGLDHVFTGREYLPRVAPSDESTTARLNR